MQRGSGPVGIVAHWSNNLGFDDIWLQVCLCDGVSENVGLRWPRPPPTWHEARLLRGDIGRDGRSYEHRGQRPLGLRLGNKLFRNWHRTWATVAGGQVLVWKCFFLISSLLKAIRLSYFVFCVYWRLRCISWGYRGHHYQGFSYFTAMIIILNAMSPDDPDNGNWTLSILSIFSDLLQIKRFILSVTSDQILD